MDRVAGHMISIGTTLNSVQTSILDALQPAPDKKTSPAQPAAATTDEVSISTIGEVFQKLDELASSDPVKYKTAVENVVTQLRESAAQLQGTTQAKALNDLADRMESASASGETTVLGGRRVIAQSGATATSSFLLDYTKGSSDSSAADTLLGALFGTTDA